MQPLRCTAHPEVETYLRCNECETPICPRCLVQTPVGAKCRTCARLRPHPLYALTPLRLLRGVGGALGAGLGLGLAWGALQGLLPFLGWLAWLAYVGMGYLVGEATSAAANRKRGRTLQYAAVAGTALAFAASFAVRLDLLRGAVRINPNFWMVLLPTDIGSLIVWALLAVACLIAASRVR